MKKDSKLEVPPVKRVEVMLIESTVEKRNEILANARETAEHILKAAEQECNRIRTKIDEQVSNNQENEIQILKDRILSMTTLEGEKLLMRARDDALSQVFEDVKDQLQKIAEGQDETFNFKEILKKLAIEAILAIGGKTFSILANERDINYLMANRNELVRQVQPVLGEVTIQILDKPIATIGGVIVQNGDGTKIYYNTLENRLNTVRSRREAVVSEVLEAL